MSELTERSGPEAGRLPASGPAPELGSRLGGPRTRGAREKKKPQTPFQKLVYGVRELVIVVGSAILLSMLIKTFLVQAFWIPSESMENTLLTGDQVLVNKLQPDMYGLSRGDIVVFHDPGNWMAEAKTPQRSALMERVHNTLAFVGLAPNDSDDFIIKRVIGMPGDHVVANGNGDLSVNGVPVHESYLAPGTVPSLTPFDVVVPADHLWVLGDNRDRSGDSRYHENGFVPMDKVVGRAMVTIWPLDRWASHGGTEVFSLVPEPRSPAPTSAVSPSALPTTSRT